MFIYITAVLSCLVLSCHRGNKRMCPFWNLRCTLYIVSRWCSQIHHLLALGGNKRRGSGSSQESICCGQAFGGGEVLWIQSVFHTRVRHFVRMPARTCARVCRDQLRESGQCVGPRDGILPSNLERHRAWRRCTEVPRCSMHGTWSCVRYGLPAYQKGPEISEG